MVSAQTDEAEGSGSRQYHPIVQIINGFKNFGIFNSWQNVLQKFNLTAYSGELYALLGPHGCGKTTVLNVILGLSKLNHGSVEVFGFKPGTPDSGIPGIRVGYAPQSLGLYEKFTVSEIFNYYGSLLRLSPAYVNERITFLNILLSLPIKNTYVKHCPETMKRQISFAVALLHEPELLILDEPTAGVDPLLRKNIWDYLLKLVNEYQKCVIVTSQYGFEVSSSHRVGVMRDGHLVEENDPKTLFRKYMAKDFESVYMCIYEKDLSSTQYIYSKNTSARPGVVTPHRVGSEGFDYEIQFGDDRKRNEQTKKTSTSPMSGLCNWLDANFLNCKRFAATIKRNFVLLYRNFLYLLMFILVPVTLLVIFNVFIGREPQGVILSIVNRDVKIPGSKYSGKGSSVFLQLIPTDIIQETYENVTEAINSIRETKSSGLLVIGSQFSKNYYAGPEVSNTSLKPCIGTLRLRLTSSCITFYSDYTHRLNANYLSRTLLFVVFQYGAKVARNPRLKFNQYSIYSEGRPLFGSIRDTFGTYSLPGFTILLIYHMTIYFAALSYLYLRKNNLMIRDYMAGVTTMETSLAGYFTNLLTMVIAAGLLIPPMYASTYLDFKKTIHVTSLIFLSQIILGLSVGNLLGGFLWSGTQVSLATMCLFMINLIIGGMIWTFKTLPPTAGYYIFHANPISYAAHTLRHLSDNKLLDYESFYWSIFYSLGLSLILLSVFIIFRGRTRRG